MATLCSRKNSPVCSTLTNCHKPLYGVAGVIAQHGLAEQAQMLAEHLGLVFFTQAPAEGLMLSVTPRRLQLEDAGHPSTRAVYVDFHSSDVKKRLRAGRRSNLARAIGLGKSGDTSVFDATCGLGRDAAVLMGLGCSVQACERNPLMQTLLRDGIERAGSLPGWRGLITTSATDWLAAQEHAVADVIYLDPMFGGQRSALPKWELQTLQAIVGDDEDIDDLLAIARLRARRRVVIKRHPRAPELAPPSLQVRGKRARFDIYLTD